ncbi:hypothetical protein [Agrobacterium sp.]|jgi:hypothetical protein|uniref:hypothetical protein n=1 Tax=Agrobacterium sp. TaxID=361 RepID=UPI0028ABC2CC
MWSLQQVPELVLVPKLLNKGLGMIDAVCGNDIKTLPKVFASWADVELAVHELVAAKSDIQRDTFENTRMLIRFASDRYPVPDKVCLGYWPTIRLCWSSSESTCEIEVNENQYEFYRFSDAACAITHVDVTRGDVLDEVRALMDGALLQVGG